MKRLILAILLSLTIPMTVQAEEIEIPEGFERVRCSCYTASEGKVTANGSTPTEGMCASKRANFGDIYEIYTEDFEFIGYFEITDTGSDQRIKNGTRIDIFRNDMESVNEWISKYGDYAYARLIECD